MIIVSKEAIDMASVLVIGGNLEVKFDDCQEDSFDC